jgi:HD superfamily phosphohydrolase
MLQCTNLFEKLTKLDILALFVAALCHDVGHKGFTDSEPMFMLYKREKVLECYHLKETIKLLSKEECNLFSALDMAQFRAVWRLIVVLILSTHFSTHFAVVRKYGELVQGCKFDFQRQKHRDLLMKLILKAADLVDVATQHMGSVLEICSEVFMQADLGDVMGIRYLDGAVDDPFKIDRERSQVAMLAYVCLPMFESL